MSTLAEKLKKRRRDEQEIRGYANSSRWYTGLSNAISFLDRAEAGTDPINRFSDAWSVAYNLFMMHGEPGDEEYRRFNSWVSAVKDYAGVRHHFVNSGDPVLGALQQAVERAKKTLLKPDGLQALESWIKGVSPDKGCRYFFLIIRDMRNTAYHPEFNPNTAPVKKAIGAAADALIPIVAAAVDATIEHPVPGTTGRAAAYRFFLWPFLKNSDGFFSDYYLERLFPDDELAAFPEDQAKDSLKLVAKQWEAREPGLRTADATETSANWLQPVLFEVLGAKPASGIRIVGEEAVFEPTFVLPKAGAKLREHHGDLRGKAGGNLLSCLIWTLPWHTSLDSVATDPAFAALPVIEVVHRALAASDVPWAIVTNGRQLRLLSRATSHKPRCFLEADLVALVDRRTDQQALRCFRFVLGLFSARCFTQVDEDGHSLLERVALGSDRHGKEIGDELKSNVFSALQELGEGFLAYMRANPKATDEWREQKRLNLSRDKFLGSDAVLDDIYHESLSLMYRLLFIFYAESRELLPLDNETYLDSYSLESIRDEVRSVQDDPDPRQFFAKGDIRLWSRLRELFKLLNLGWANVIPAYNGGLFDPEKHEFLEKFGVGDFYLARAIDLLSRTKPRAGQNRGEGRKKVTYRDLDVRHLGSIYEGILEYTAHIADQDYVVLRQNSGTEDYKAVTELERAEKAQFTAWQEAMKENHDSPRLPRGCRVSGHVTKGQYYLAFGGRDSKRKSSGSYYTPDYIVQYIIENTLGPLVRGECRPKPEAPTDELKAIGWTSESPNMGRLGSKEILDLRVVDPAMGSGHFLVAATEYLARSYRDALLGEGAPVDEAKADQEFIRYKRIIAERCIYGVDLNPMAVELAKLSMWLFTMDPGRPLSFLDHHFKCGNALVGSRVEILASLPNVPASGRPTITLPDPLQINLFEDQFRAFLPTILRDILGIVGKETLTTQDIADKKTLDIAVGSLKAPFRYLMDLWVGAFFGEDASSYLSFLSNVQSAVRPPLDVATDQRFFHWEIEFPEVFYDIHGNRLENAGFDTCIGNPPYINANTLNQILHPAVKPFWSAMFESARGTYDLYILFMEQGMRLVNISGLSSLITPNKFLSAPYGIALREYIARHGSLVKLFDVSRTAIFEDPSIYPVVSVLSKRTPQSSIQVDYPVDTSSKTASRKYDAELLDLLPDRIWGFLLSEGTDLLRKILSVTVSLGDVCTVNASSTAAEADHYNEFISEDRPAKANAKKWRFVNTGTIDPYRLLWGEAQLSHGGKQYVRPVLWADGVSANRASQYDARKIIFAKIANRIEAALDESGQYASANTNFALCDGDDAYFYLGLLNSTLMTWIYEQFFGALRMSGGYLQFQAPQLRVLPVFNLKDRGGLASVEVARDIATLVKQHIRKPPSSLLEDVDQLVFELYGLAHGERKMIRGGEHAAD